MTPFNELYAAEMTSGNKYNAMSAIRDIFIMEKPLSASFSDPKKAIRPPTVIVTSANGAAMLRINL